MKNFQNYTPEKYSKVDFQFVEDGIYLARNPYEYGPDKVFVTSLSFEMEPERYCEEEASPRNITQIPFENLLDEFNVFVTDFYEQLNEVSEKICYQEFGSLNLSGIQKLRTIIGKRFYAVPYIDEVDGEECHRVVFE